MVGTYKFGQLRSNQIQTYMKPLQYTLDDKKVESSLSKGTIFLDKAIELSGENQLQGLTSQGKMRSFYLRLRINKTSTIQTFDIILRNTTLLKDNSQTLGTIQVEAGTADDYSTFEFVFTPNENRTFNQIHLELQRIVDDYEIEREDGTYGRLPQITVEHLNEIINIIDILNPSIDGKGMLKQIGIQSAPGFTMCINGEQIKVGRSGQYEIKNSSIQIFFIGFIVEDEDTKFILDYQY